MGERKKGNTEKGRSRGIGMGDDKGDGWGNQIISSISKDVDQWEFSYIGDDSVNRNLEKNFESSGDVK